MKKTAAVLILAFLVLLFPFSVLASSAPIAIEPIMFKGSAWYPLLLSNDPETLKSELELSYREDSNDVVLRLWCDREFDASTIIDVVVSFKLITPDGSTTESHMNTTSSSRPQEIVLVYTPEEYFPAEVINLLVDGEEYVMSDVPHTLEALDDSIEFEEPEEIDTRTEEEIALADRLKEFRSTMRTPVEELPELHGKLFIAVFGPDSSLNAEDAQVTEVSRAGEDFHGIPGERFANSYEEADTVIFIYRKKKVVGHYSSGGMALEVTTALAIFSGDEEVRYDAVVNEPPQTIYGLPGSGGAGEYEPETALSMLAEVLKDRE